MISERRACRLAGPSRDSVLCPPVVGPTTHELTGRLTELTKTRRRFGYRRLHDLLQPEFPGVDHKRVFRLCQMANLAVRRRKVAEFPSSLRQPLLPALASNELWSMDCVSGALANGRKLRCLTIGDDFTHEAVEIVVDHGINGAYVARVLD